ncbi:transaldolase [Serinibacter salmoneus]|uniref:Transaldolase n=1 Tax=Serinibacter salmoneus TaxID=556530 RepID=A0A2A9D1J5_9MICO|nr:transaldolase [Serinibacter salmoneus]PFG19720.1 transaldolase [Serinibacter salmoneus]
MATDPLARIVESGVSPWLDDLSRARLASGNLTELIRTRHVVGVTTNPTIFDKAIADGEAYAEQVAALAAAGAGVEEAVRAMTTDDVRAAADVFAAELPQARPGDARVSIEVDPRLAHDTEGTIAQARELWSLVDRSNVYIKIPATPEGLLAITEVISEGISVNATLIFDVDTYRAVALAYLDGLERAKAAGVDLSAIASVASVFLSRIDAKIDPVLEGIGTPEALELRGTAAIAGARATYGAYLEIIGSPRWQSLAQAGAQVQRPLWASTGTKNADYPDTMYVDQLVVADVVNTMPEKTLQASFDHARVPAGEDAFDTVTDTVSDAVATLEAVVRVGVPYEEIIATLTREGVESFIASWENLLATVTAALQDAA